MKATDFYASMSNVIIDDIVLWDGRTLMGVPGGAGTHALSGMRVWVEPEQPLGLIAWVGADFDAGMRAHLGALNIDDSGLLLRRDPTSRAWQIIERDDSRFEHFRTDLGALSRNAPVYADWPPAYRVAHGMHLMANNSVRAFTETVNAVKRASPQMTLVLEPSPEQDDAVLADYAGLLPQLALFSPDIDQARALSGRADALDMARVLLDAGAPLVAIRMGAAGSLLCSAAGERLWLPAVPPRALIDATGAGNAYCGGFAVALARGLTPLEAGLRAAVSASFALEQFGVPQFGAPQSAALLAEERERRLAWARAHVRTA
jgi:sugar/nucleoside kinase (ribokinase family)